MEHYYFIRLGLAMLIVVLLITVGARKCDSKSPSKGASHPPVFSEKTNTANIT